MNAAGMVRRLLTVVARRVCRRGHWTTAHRHDWRMVIARDRVFVQCSACGCETPGLYAADRISHRRKAS